MLLRFTKAAPGARSDALTCQGRDGRTLTLELPRQGVLPRAAIRYVVETTLGWGDGWLAELAAGIAGKAKTAKRAMPGDAIAECLEAEQWGGASEPNAFLAKVAAACAKRRIAPPTLTTDDVTRLRTKLRAFGAAWRPLPPGGTLEFEA